jgi:UDP-2-acetamido-3-amino-2,3-dideoxy-glucuronate N-acetyltransferase
MNTKARLLDLPQFRDSRGILTVGDADVLPFQPVRFFVISGVPGGAVRGRHAHKSCHQLVVMVQGTCKLTLIDQHGRDELTVSSGQAAVYIPPMIWGEQSDFSPDAAVLVLASDPYDAGDYIRSVEELLAPQPTA